MSSSQTKLTGAVFGLGRAGRIHYGNIVSLRLARIKYVVDADKKAAVATVAELSGQDEASRVTILLPEEEDRVFADAEVAFCVVCSPTMTHEAVIRKCIASGKQIFCEKPVAKSREGMIECYRLAAEKGILLHCSFNRRYDPSFSIVRERIATTCDQAHTIRTCSRDSPFPGLEYLRTSGGIYHDCGVHDLDMACWLAGEWPTSVYATGACHDPRLREFGDHDTAVIVLKFPSGAVGLLELSRHSTYGYDQRIEVHGPNGMIASNNVTDRAVTTSNGQGVTSVNIQHSFPQRYAEGYIRSMRCFLNRITGADADAQTITALEAINVSGLADACELSVQTGAAVSFSPVDSL